MSEAERLFHNLQTDGLREAQGAIQFSLLGLSAVIKSKSAVGDVLQDWLEHYLRAKNIVFSVPGNSQSFPDFILGSGSTEELLEIKCFDGAKSPNFDIANFEAYCHSLLKNPERLDSYYLIFAYAMNPKDSTIRIKNFWLKRVWQIAAASEAWPLKLQIKKGMIYNIRPATWYSPRSTYAPFTTRRAFAEALAECIRIYPATNHLHKGRWLEQIASRYQSVTGHAL